MTKKNKNNNNNNKYNKFAFTQWRFEQGVPILEQSCKFDKNFRQSEFSPQ